MVWKNGSADQYVVWASDSNGNYVSSLTGVVSGTSATLESYETILYQDLNGDGTIGIPVALSAASDAFVFQSAPLSKVTATAEGAEYEHWLSSFAASQATTVLAESKVAGLVGIIDLFDINHATFHVADPTDHFIIS